MATVKKSAKLNVYKFVAVKKAPSRGGKDGQLAQSFAKTTSAINNVGLVLNGIGSVLKEIRDIQVAIHDSFQRSLKASQFTPVYNLPSAPTGMDAPDAPERKKKKMPGFLESILSFLGNVLKIVVGGAVIKWLSKEENRELVRKTFEVLKSILDGLVNFFGTTGKNAIEGLYDLLCNDEIGWLDKFGAFFKGFTALGLAIVGIRWLKNPMNIIKDFKGVLKFFHQNLLKSKKTLLGKAGKLGIVIGAAAAGYAAYQMFTQEEEDPVDNVELASGGPLKERAAGGWISGPMSGYPVSLDGGKSTAFIGHGTEYVTQKAGGGYVIPVDTPKTKNNPALMGSRMNEALRMGFDLSGMKIGSHDEPKQRAAGGAIDAGMKTGPSHRIGGSAEYHIDTKFHKSLGKGKMVSILDSMANAYAKVGRKIEFSGHLVQGRVWNPKDSKRQALLNKAIESHSHSQFMRAEGFLPFDYYNPKKAGNRFDKSVEGAPILLPQVGGKTKVGTKYGGYGRSAEIFDAAGKMVALTGHGDTSKGKNKTIGKGGSAPTAAEDAEDSYDAHTGERGEGEPTADALDDAVSAVQEPVDLVGSLTKLTSAFLGENAPDMSDMAPSDSAVSPVDPTTAPAPAAAPSTNTAPASSANPPGALVSGQRPDKSLTNAQWKIQQTARAEANSQNLTGAERDRYIAGRVMGQIPAPSTNISPSESSSTRMINQTQSSVQNRNQRREQATQAVVAVAQIAEIQNAETKRVAAAAAQGNAQAAKASNSQGKPIVVPTGGSSKPSLISQLNSRNNILRTDF
jgi:hypothetical protein